jgi:hypothetical protein
MRQREHRRASAAHQSGTSSWRAFLSSSYVGCYSLMDSSYQFHKKVFVFYFSCSVSRVEDATDMEAVLIAADVTPLDVHEVAIVTAGPAHVAAVVEL